MTGSKVVGRRLGFWRGTNPFWLAFIFLFCPLCVVLGVRYLVGLRHVPYLFDNFGDYLVQSAVAVVGIIMGLVAILTLKGRRRAYMIVSACPACGFEKLRDFRDATDKKVWPIPCDHCLAYLRVHPKKLVVREIPRDEPTNNLSLYCVWKEQYIDIVPRRDEKDRPFAFVMPQICAICSAPDAPFLSEIGTLDSVAGKGFFRGALYPTNYVGKTTPAKRDDVDEALTHIKTPVCAVHKGQIAIEQSGGGYLYFSTYRYYREFCELNHITEGPDVAYARAEGKIPQAVARVTPSTDDDASDRSASA